MEYVFPEGIDMKGSGLIKFT